jgi:hypothetical protein
LRGKKAAIKNLLGEPGVSFRKRPKRIKAGVVKVVKKEIQRTSRWLSTAKAG